MTAVVVRDTPVARITLCADRLICLRHREGAALNAEHMRDSLRIVSELCAGQPHRFLVDLRGVRSADRGARQAPAAPEMLALVSRAALLVGGPVTRVIASFFLRVVAPGYPTRIFDDEAAARAWLLEEPTP